MKSARLISSTFLFYIYAMLQILYTFLACILANFIYFYTIKFFKKDEKKETVFKHLIAPLFISFKHLKISMGRIIVTKTITNLESTSIYETNKKIQEIITTNFHLIPVELIEDSIKLMIYLDVWFESYNRLRIEKKPIINLIFSGPKGYPYPKEIEKMINTLYIEYKKELY